MVRLMHSMVRFNVLSRPDQWDPRIYGIPIPPGGPDAGRAHACFRARQGSASARARDIHPAERARVELARYRGFLLGLPAELLPEAPHDIVDVLIRGTRPSGSASTRLAVRSFARR